MALLTKQLLGIPLRINCVNCIPCIMIVDPFRFGAKGVADLAVAILAWMSIAHRGLFGRSGVLVCALLVLL